MSFKTYFLTLFLILSSTINAGLNITAPVNPFVTFEDSIKITGTVSPNTMLFLQDSPVYIRNDNVFELGHQLPTGDSTIWLTTIDNSGNKESQPIHFRRLIIPQIVLEIPALNPYTVLMNTNFLHPKTLLRKGEEEITREEFKFFAENLSHALSTENMKTTPVLNNYIDGNFHPDAPVTELDYVITLLSLNNETFNENAIKTYWVDNLVKTAQNKNLLGYSKTINPSANLNTQKLYDWATNIPIIKIAEEQLYNLSTENNTEEVEIIQNKIDAVITTLQENRAGVFSLESPQDYEVIIDSKVTFIGIASPNTTITINAITTKSDFNGNFQHTEDLVLGKNDFMLTNVNGSIETSIYSYDGFEDMKFHPFRKDAAELKYYGLIENTQQFLPSTQLSPSEAIKIAEPFIQVVVTQNISELSEADHIQTLAKWNLNPLLSNNQKLDWIEQLTTQDEIINYIERVKLNAEEEFRDTI